MKCLQVMKKKIVCEFTDRGHQVRTMRHARSWSVYSTYGWGRYPTAALAFQNRRRSWQWTIGDDWTNALSRVQALAYPFWIRLYEYSKVRQNRLHFSVLPFDRALHKLFWRCHASKTCLVWNKTAFTKHWTLFIRIHCKWIVDLPQESPSSLAFESRCADQYTT